MNREMVSTKGPRQWQGIPGIERASNGRLWCTFFTGGPKEPDPDNTILLTTRAAGETTWSEPTVTIALPGLTRAYDPALWHDPDGRLWLFYNQANLETKDFSVWAITTVDSTEDTPVWTLPRKIDVGVPFAFRLNKPVVLSTGEWLLPVTWARTAPDGWFAAETQIQGVAISTDSGVTWTLHGGVEAPPWALENMVVERRDGSAWMLIRTGSGVLWESVSTDAGRTWSTASPTTIVNPGVRFFISRLQSGRLLLINTPDPRHRRGLRASVTTGLDERVFSTGLELDERNNVSYPDAIQGTDGLIYAVHDCDRGGAGEIILDVFSEEEILTAGATSADSMALV